VSSVAPDSVNIIDAEARLVAGPGRDLVVNITAVTVIDDAASKEAGAFAVPAVVPANLACAYLPGMARMRQMSTDDVLLCDAASPIAKPAPLAPRPARSVVGHHTFGRMGPTPVRQWRELRTVADVGGVPA
jgi:hypothetical protein